MLLIKDDYKNNLQKNMIGYSLFIKKNSTFYFLFQIEVELPSVSIIVLPVIVTVPL